MRQVREQCQVDAACKSAASGGNMSPSQVRGHQRAAARGVHTKSWPVQGERVGDASRRDAGGTPCGSER